jgi:RNA polymerase sigma factor (sigma-70 family)
MMDTDTSIGGPQSRFPETRYSAIQNLGNPESALREGALEALVAAYWKPVYKYIRVRWNQSNENAKDLTQTFFARVLEKDFFTAYDPAKARFRTYLRSCLDAFLVNVHKSANRIKCGGNAQIVSLDFETAEGEIRGREIPSNEQSPEDYFHREWVRNVFSLAAQDLKRDCEQRGRRIQYELFERYDLCDDDERPTYDALGAELGITRVTVTNHIAAARRRLRQIVLDRIRECTATEREFRDEVRSVLGIEA